MLRRASDESEFAEVATPTGNSHTDSDATVGRTYYYKVEAVNDAGSSEPSESAQALILPPPPLAPVNLEASATDASVTLTWQAPDDESITTYMVFRLVRDADPPDDPQLVFMEGSEALEFADTEVQADTGYEYRVVSVNLSAMSDPATVEVDTLPVDPDATRDGAVSLGAQSPSQGRQFFRDKSLDRAGGDAVDYYTFTTDARYQLGLGARGQTIELMVTLEDADGNAVGTAGPPLDRNKDQVYIEWLNITVDAGTYYVRVQAMEDGQTDYYLRFALTTP